MLSSEVLAEIRKMRILISITAGLIIVAFAVFIIKSSGISFVYNEIIILLLSIVDLSIHLRIYKRFYKDIGNEGYEYDVKNRIKYQQLNLKLKKMECIIIICAAMVFLIGFIRAIVHDYNMNKWIIEPSFVILWFVFNLRQFLWK